ncbi:uncharacterized protein LOC126766666 [Bactrocera neohumeralis]|uniref:uncharacterized protein LOC126766666 n=1 Tax=Bactrocera neohumeralis TaxID=98809 RepID=UPI0021655BC4|nr:uncharacterized protein LOC126766666 [Bactrocera neohumeralis]
MQSLWTAAPAKPAAPGATWTASSHEKRQRQSVCSSKEEETNARIRGCFLQVVKETALCFLVLQGQEETRERVAAAAGSGGSSSSADGTGVTVRSQQELVKGKGVLSSSTAAASLTARLLRQEAVVSYTQEVLSAALRRNTHYAGECAGGRGRRRGTYLLLPPETNRFHLWEERVDVGREPREGVADIQSSTEYQRFKAYVASAKDDFRLVHQVDVFVERQPTGLHATLLPHQLDGLRFLVSLHANGINGILADEMGVGKTIQTLAFLLFLKERRMEMPLAFAAATEATGLTLSSLPCPWCGSGEACAQFVPDSLRVTTYDELEDPVEDASLYDIVLMPIHSVRSPSVLDTAPHISWGYLVVDEAHKAVSNLRTLTAQAILQLPYERRLVLTGTPLNSDLQELWSLLYFLNSEVFTDGDSFDEIFRRPFATYEAAEMELSSEERGLLVLRLHQILRPFMLRRTKRTWTPTCA